jgi:hypothetical protein
MLRRPTPAFLDLHVHHRQVFVEYLQLTRLLRLIVDPFRDIMMLRYAAPTPARTAIGRGGRKVAAMATAPRPMTKEPA